MRGQEARELLVAPVQVGPLDGGIDPIAAAREWKLPHVYLGFYVEGCRSLEYKGRFRPNEALDADGEWRLFLE